MNRLEEKADLCVMPTFHWMRKHWVTFAKHNTDLITAVIVSGSVSTTCKAAWIRCVPEVLCRGPLLNFSCCWAPCWFPSLPCCRTPRGKASASSRPFPMLLPLVWLPTRTLPVRTLPPHLSVHPWGISIVSLTCREKNQKPITQLV